MLIFINIYIYINMNKMNIMTLISNSRHMYVYMLFYNVPMLNTKNTCFFFF